MSGRQDSVPNRSPDTGAVVRLLLPLPPRELSPNWRGHWAKKWKASSQYRTTCRMLAYEAAKFSMPTKMRITATFRFADERQRDLDNCVAAFKPALDGIVDAKLIFSDAEQWLAYGAPRIERVKSKAGEGVLVEIQEIEG